MDEVTIRQYAEAHGKAAVTGDMVTLMADIDPSAMEALGTVAGAFPSPLESAEVASLRLEGDVAVVQMAYTGNNTTVTVESRWAERDGRPKVIDAKLA